MGKHEKDISHSLSSFARGTEKRRENQTGLTGSIGCSLKRDVGLIECRNKPFDSTQGHESFDYAQDPEVLEGQRRMASLFHHSLNPMPANAPHRPPPSESLERAHRRCDLSQTSREPTGVLFLLFCLPAVSLPASSPLSFQL